MLGNKPITDGISTIRAFPRSMRGVMVVVVCILSLPERTAAHEANTGPPGKTMTAVRVRSVPPKIDGILNDEVWQYAPAASGFTQREPVEGVAATESTTVQIMYDDDALYIGIMAYDREPEKIVTRLVRRDQGAEADRLSINIDSHHDHQTAHWFAIKAGGSLEDGYVSNDDWDDQTWDGVWDARYTIHDQGWSAEFLIPYHVLRFNPRADYTWGINVIRYISRKKERDYWVMIPRKEQGWVSRMGHLTGIHGIHPPTHMEMLPYTLTRSTVEPARPYHAHDWEFLSRLGGDLRYGLTSSTSLNATLNPDFGQVEADPAVLNLSVFETFFEERRPFFIEGSQIFQTPFQLFYSRRIGRQPGQFAPPADSRLLEQPEFTTILGAAKLTGKTMAKTTFGLLEAVTMAEDATIETITIAPVGGLQQSERRSYRIEPLTSYMVGRMQQDLLTGNSSIGLLLTAVNRNDAGSSYAGGIDWNLKWHNNAYQISGQLAGSRVNHPTARQDGYATQVTAAKTSGWFRSEVHLETLSPGFQANDLGFIRRANIRNAQVWLNVRKDRRWGVFHRNQLNLNAWAGRNYDGVTLQKAINVNTWHQLTSFWWVGGEVTHHFEVLDDLDTRGGTLVVKPAGTTFFVSIESDSRKAIGGEVWTEWGSTRGGNRWWSVGPQVAVKLTTRAEISLRPSYRWSFDNAQWVTNIDENGDGGIEHVVYGELTSRVLDLTTRANVIFTRDLSLELYLQPFVTVGDYRAFKELARPSSYEFLPHTGTIANPDFSRRSLRGNLVLRWEYRPGSTVFFVWSQSRSASSSNPVFRPFEGVWRSFLDDGSNIFLIKVNYWLGL